VDLNKHRFVLEVIERLNAVGSWTGKTHVQKSVFFTVGRDKIPTPFDYVLYKHGPFSFELGDVIEEMVSYSGIVAEPVQNFGVMLKLGPQSDFIRDNTTIEPETLLEIEKVCQFVSNRKVKELERLATAAWICHNEQISEETEVASRLNSLKPHISETEALSAIGEVKDLLG